MENKVVAMVLAGGKGSRLQALTKKTAKPAVSFAAKYRIIDFPLSNCANSDIDIVGVLTQYESTELDSYIGNGEKWGLNGVHCLMSSLAPRQTENGLNWYRGTADAIAQNIEFLDNQDPEYVLILSGDHIYKTTFNKMISLHVNSKADATISVIEVDKKDASRFGILNTNKNGRVIEFEEKPKQPKSTLANMGVYVFTWKVLREYLVADLKDEDSSHDFGHDIIPKFIRDKKRVMAYKYEGYWRDVGTLSSLHAANMDIALNRGIDLFDHDLHTRIYTEDTNAVPQYIGKQGKIVDSIANQGSIILGEVNTCVVSSGAVIEKNAVCTRCVIMTGAYIKEGAVINNAIIAPGTVVGKNKKINVDSNTIVLVN